MFIILLKLQPETASITVIFFQVSDYRINACTLAEVLSLFILSIRTQCFLKGFGDVDECIPDFTSSTVTPFEDTVSEFSFRQLLHLFNSLVQCVPVKFISKTQGTCNYTGTGSCDGYLVFKLVQFMLFLLADALHINLGAQFPFHVAYEPSGYGTPLLIRFPGFTLVSWVIAEALVVGKIFRIRL
ncbi:hypothetical protein ING2E5A_2547 [Petrimonas mucosa]|uniref:Uncharacterized protein n=1 Tax=Petrimonas mucosa TaxID=1642646 RepID=A0A1G4G9X0_9BACT|nr:hypothetical protein ING2E5A_2547 [Petrimonas mucosa]